ncbi:MAG: chemotaxis protein CheW [Candidatus Aminicenantes bacterium]|nr:chemotaxis protein CheW [Candidatus Aminicenantes bacterium]
MAEKKIAGFPAKKQSLPRLKENQQSGRDRIVVFALDEPHYALLLSSVERVVRAVEITPLPKAPKIVLGIINAQGRIIPVIDVRQRFRLPAREMKLDNRFIIASTSRRLVALMVDSVAGVRELADGQMVNVEQSLPFAEYLKGVAKLEDNLVLIHDLDQFLSLDEEKALDAALAGGHA